MMFNCSDANSKMSHMLRLFLMWGCATFSWQHQIKPSTEILAIYMLFCQGLNRLFTEILEPITISMNNLFLRTALKFN